MDIYKYFSQNVTVFLQNSGFNTINSVEALFWFIEHTINTELAAELSFLAAYDETKKAIQEIVDMPDRQIDLFIRFCVQNNGRLSARKRGSHFDFLSDEELAWMEQAVTAAYSIG